MAISYCGRNGERVLGFEIFLGMVERVHTTIATGLLGPSRLFSLAFCLFAIVYETVRAFDDLPLRACGRVLAPLSLPGASQML